MRQWGWADDFRKLAPFGRTREYLVAMKGNREAIAALDAFDRGMRRIRSNGTLERIRERWE